MSNINYRTKVFNDYKPEDLKFGFKKDMISAIYFPVNEKHPDGYAWKFTVPQTPILVSTNASGKTTLFNLIKEAIKLKKPERTILSFDLIEPSEEDALAITTAKHQYIKLLKRLTDYVNKELNKTDDIDAESPLFRIMMFLNELSDKLLLPHCSFRVALKAKLETAGKEIRNEFGLSFYHADGVAFSANDLSNSTLCLLILFLKIFVSIKENENPIVFIDGALDRYHPSLAELLINELTGHFPSTQFFIITNNPAVIMDLKNPNDTYFHLHEIFGD